MSSILKALEKAEESSGTKRMAGESGLIRSRKPRPVWVMPVSVLCGAAVATLATFAAMGGFSRKVPTVQPPVQAAKAAPAAAAPETTALPTSAATPAQNVATPAGALLVAKPGATPVTNPSPSAPGTALTSAKTPPGTNLKAVVLPKQAPAGRVQAADVGESKAAPSQNNKAAQPSRKVAAAAAVAVAPRPASLQSGPVSFSAPVQGNAVPEAAPAVAAVPAHPEPKVSGVAYQNNGSSFAVVNGRAVLQGGTVDGFKVLEIHQDRVRFSGSNGTFDVPVGDDEK
jgi:general secretion pathway protein B